MKFLKKKSIILKILLLIIFSIYFFNNNEKTVFFYKNIKYKIKISSIQVDLGIYINSGINITKYVDNEKTISTTYAYSLKEFNKQSNSHFFIRRLYFLDNRHIKISENFSEISNSTLYFP